MAMGERGVYLFEKRVSRTALAALVTRETEESRRNAILNSEKFEKGKEVRRGE